MQRNAVRNAERLQFRPGLRRSTVDIHVGRHSPSRCVAHQDLGPHDVAVWSLHVYEEGKPRDRQGKGDLLEIEFQLPLSRPNVALARELKSELVMVTYLL